MLFTSPSATTSFLLYTLFLFFSCLAGIHYGIFFQKAFLDINCPWLFSHLSVSSYCYYTWIVTCLNMILLVPICPLNHVDMSPHLLSLIIAVELPEAGVISSLSWIICSLYLDVWRILFYIKVYSPEIFFFFFQKSWYWSI